MSVKGFKIFDELGNLLRIERYDYKSLDNAPTKVSEFENDSKYAKEETVNNLQTSLSNHKDNDSNPHSVTKSQVGLGNVPNVATNDQTPTYSVATTLATLTSGEKLSVAFGKIKLAITNLINHIANKSNPHKVSLTQLGLTATSTELNYMKGVTSNIQTQLDARFKAYGTKNTDFNTITALGSYWCQLASCTNTPFGDNPTGRFGHLIVFNSNNGICQQFFQHGNDVIISVWVRDNVNGWHDWKRIDADGVTLAGLGITASADRLNKTAAYFRSSDKKITNIETAGTVYVTNLDDSKTMPIVAEEFRTSSGHKLTSKANQTDLDGINPFKGVFDSGNIDELMTYGVYWVNLNQNSTTITGTIPPYVNTQFGYFEVLKAYKAGTDCMQRFTEYFGGLVHTRVYVNDGWLDWETSINSDSPQTLTNKTYNGYTLGDACAKDVYDKTSAAAIGTGTGLSTDRRIYYGLPTINGSHSYNSNTNIYAPTSVGTNGYVLVSNGSGAPSWKDLGSISSSIGTFTYGSDATYFTSGNSSVSIKKHGKVVTISGYIYGINNGSTNDVEFTVGTVPSGFRPPSNVYGLAWYGGGSDSLKDSRGNAPFIINSSGVMTMTAIQTTYSGRRMHFTVTYVIS